MTRRMPEFGLIYWPSVRSIAYASVLRDEGLCPSEVIILKNCMDVLGDLRKAADVYGYNDYFDISLDAEAFFRDSAKSVYDLNVSDVNDDAVLKSLIQCQSRDFIFTGGGIVKDKLLAVNKRLIHIHPGILPYCRGSTCFYYNIIENEDLGATAFFMREALDAGPILSACRFHINYEIQDEETYFMDYILDPFIRAETLRSALQSLMEQKKPKANEESVRYKPYYVMHPILRLVAMQKINMMYCEANPVGIFRRKQ